MIQRRQSLYLLIATLIASSLLFFNYQYYSAKGQAIEGDEHVVVKVGYFTTQWDDQEAENNSFLIGTLAGYAGLAFLTIFFFKNRKRQIFMTTIGFFLLLCSFYCIYMYSLGMDFFITDGEREFFAPVFVPFTLLIFQFLALRGMKKDDALVRSLDRIR